MPSAWYRWKFAPAAIAMLKHPVYASGGGFINQTSTDCL